MEIQRFWLSENIVTQAELGLFRVLKVSFYSTLKLSIAYVRISTQKKPIVKIYKFNSIACSLMTSPVVQCVGGQR